MGDGLTAAETWPELARGADRIAGRLAEQRPDPEARQIYRRLVERAGENPEEQS